MKNYRVISSLLQVNPFLGSLEGTKIQFANFVITRNQK